MVSALVECVVCGDGMAEVEVSSAIDTDADSRTERAFVVCVGELLGDGLWYGDSEADSRTVRALVVPVLVRLVWAASVHSPAAEQSVKVVVTVTDSVSTGTIAPRLFVT
jgi:hypothetical protein